MAGAGYVHLLLGRAHSFACRFQIEVVLQGGLHPGFFVTRLGVLDREVVRQTGDLAVAAPGQAQKALETDVLRTLVNDDGD